MVIDVNSLKRQGKTREDISFSVPIDGDLSLSPEIEFCNGKFEGEVVIADKVEIKGKFSYDAKGVCARCLEPCVNVVEYDVDATFCERPEEDDYAYKSGRIDLKELFFDSVLASQPYLLLCKQDCRGLCFKCGCNLNNGSCSCEK